MAKVKLFLRTDKDGHTVIFGKLLGKLTEDNEAIFEGSIDEDLVLSGKFRKPLIETESCSTTQLMRELGEI